MWLKLGGWSLGQICFLSNFLASCYDRSSLHELLCFIGCTSSHMAQTGRVGGAWANLGYDSSYLGEFVRSVLGC